MENYSSWFQTENDSGGLQMNKCSVLWTKNDNVRQTDKRCGRKNDSGWFQT